jgi:hypothetical protein
VGGRLPDLLNLIEKPGIGVRNVVLAVPEFLSEFLVLIIFLHCH